MLKSLLVGCAMVSLAACSSSTKTNPDGGPTDGGYVPDQETFAWAQSFAVSQPQTSSIRAIASDSTGVVIAGDLEGNAVLGSTTLTAVSDSGNAFVAKLDLNGAVLWAQIATGGSSLFESVVLDANSNVYVSGAEYGDGNSVDFTFGGATLTNPVGFIVGLTPDGTPRFVKPMNSDTAGDPGSLAVSGSQLVVAGTMTGNGDVAGSAIDGCPNDGCVFIAGLALDSGDGQFAVKAAGAPPRSNGAGNAHEVWVVTDASGNIDLALGSYFDTGDSSAQTNQLLLLSYDATGTTTRWSKSFPMPVGTGPDVNGFAIDSAGALYVGGDSASGLVLGGTTVGDEGDFLAKLDGSGNVQGVSQPGSDEPYGIYSVSAHDGAYTFGNGNAPEGSFPADEGDMTLSTFGGSAGASLVYVGVTLHERAEAISATSAGVFIAGEGGPGDFGNVHTQNDGFFVAKLK